jgi:uncharacterized membrane protein YqjE
VTAMRGVANDGHGGILEPVWKLLDNALAVAQNRLDLFRVEAQEEKIRFAQMLLVTSAIIVLATLSLALGIITIVMLAWQDGLLTALVLLSAACAIAPDSPGGL